MGKEATLEKNLLAPGHTACAGCGQSLAARLVVNAAGPNVIVTSATGCLEVFTTGFPYSAWEVPFVHSLFENSAAMGSGIAAALKALGREDEARVISQGGDGGTGDIGIQALSGAVERGDDLLYVCYDNEAYMNTGIQRSGLTPFSSSTTTSPSGRMSMGNPRPKKNVPGIIAAHRAPYVATASVAFQRDLQKKVKKALAIRGPKYIQVHVPCPLGWRHPPNLTLQIARLAVDTGLYPLVEWEHGEVVAVRKIKPKPVDEYLKPQGRFRHLFRGDEGKATIAQVQEIADDNIARYALARAAAKE